MYLLLLLISPAFGRPSSALVDVGEGIINQIDSVVGFTEETKEVFDNSELFEIISESLKVAEQNILEMDAELKLLEVEELQFEDNYFPAYNEAKRYLRETRQGLRKLADRTVKDVGALKLLLEDLDKSNDPVLLKSSLDTMKDLMIETLEILKEALEKYNSALETFENLNSSIATQNRKLEKMVSKDSAEYEAWSTKLRGGIYGTIAGTAVGCIVADALGALGICSAVNAAISGATAAGIEAEIAKYAATLGKLKKITDRMLESGNNFDQNIHHAIDILTEEINVINNWANSAEVVNKNIDRYPQEYLTKYISIRNVFINGLDDLNNSAQQFLDQPVDILN
jgi:hypothetical protein